MSEQWIADRMHQIDSSGIRKVFDLAAEMRDPVNLSIGQPHYDTPDSIKDALCQAVRDGKNAYSQSQGVAELIERIQSDVDDRWGHDDRRVFISSGTSGALMLALSCLVNPGDEVIIFDPYFVMYKHLTRMVGGIPVFVDTYPDFHLDMDRVRKAVTPRTKMILFNSPSNPTGYVARSDEIQALAEFAAEREIALVSDEIYRSFSYDVRNTSPAAWNDQTLVIDGFSKSHSMTGWRLGYVHGPHHLIQQMVKLQQFTFVCAPHPVQWAGLAACDLAMTDRVDQYRAKRDLMLGELSDDFEVAGAGGAFYLFLRAPWGTGTEFVSEAIRQNLLIIPGNVFSEQDTHFRVSYAAEDETLLRGAEILQRVARSGR
ncbi:MAG: aminotransferase class I/II-fold pyridoxal phosphate-dependent enzyme [Planctomycetaceae bacterium]